MPDKTAFLGALTPAAPMPYREGPLPLSRCLQDAFSLDECTFLESYRGFFLVLEGRIEQEPDVLALRTRTVEAVRADQRRPVLDVFAVAKRDPNNPFASMVTIGRARNNDVVINDSSVSKMHAWIRTSRDNLHGHTTLTDSGSTNGTFVNGSPVRAETVLLPLGARIRIGSIELQLVDGRLLYHTLRRTRGRPAVA